MVTTPAPSRKLGGDQRTPGTGRKSVSRTPQSTLHPNDDGAERASVRRQRQSKALRMSLSDAFAGHNDQRSQRSQSDDGKLTLSSDALEAMFDQCMKLATENKITDRNVWQLDLISHLPEIVMSRSLVNNNGFNFQKMSGGLDAGVTIYSKRVDHTYKEAFSSLAQGCGPSKKGDDAGAEGFEDDGDDDDLEDAAATAAKAQKQQQGGKRSKHASAANEESTLAAPEQLRQKKVDNTFAVDPLFHTMSALFDEGGAKGLLLLNRSVYRGAHIMTGPHEVPEQQFPLDAAAEPDTLLDLKPLRQQLAACSEHGTAAAQAAGAPAVLTPGLQQLYDLLEQTKKAVPGRRQQQEQEAAVDVAAIMQQATRGLRPTPMPAQGGSSSQPSRAAAATGDGSHHTGAACSHQEPPSAGDMVTAAGSFDAAADSAGDTFDAGEAPADAGGSGSGGDAPAIAAFLASQAGAEDEADAAAAAGYDDDAGYGDGLGLEDAGGEEGDGHAGFEDDDASGFGGPSGFSSQQQHTGRRQSLMGLGADQAEDSDVLDAEALQQLLGCGSGLGPSSSKVSTTHGGGWAGSRYWKYRSAAAAAARMASGSAGGGAVKRAAGSTGRSKAAAFRIDFTAPPPNDLAAALAKGTRKQTCLVTAASSSAANTLLPEDLHYQASNLVQLFLRPSPISLLRQQQYHMPGHSKQAGNNGSDGTSGWPEDGPDGSGWGGEGYEDYDDDGFMTGAQCGAEGYNAGDLSTGDPGFGGSSLFAAGAAGEGDQEGPEWWSPDGELLSAPKRTAGMGVKYQRTAKQVDVRALKDLLWDKLLTVNQEKAADSNNSSPTGHDDDFDDEHAAEPPAAPGQATGPTIPFQDVIVHMPHQSAAGSLEDVSVHMCFICMLHLANEKGLVIRAKDDLKTLTISNVVHQQQE